MLPLDPTDDRAAPAFKDVQGCEIWLSQLQLTNIRSAHDTLLAQLTEFNRYPLRGTTRLATLECLRETIDHVQGELARKIFGKALPLSGIEHSTYTALTVLWRTLASGYRRCLQDCLSGDNQLAAQEALINQRSLHYCGLEITESRLAGYEPPATLWRQLHALYAQAEKRDVATLPNGASCRLSYVKTLLISHAHPYRMARSQIEQMTRWLDLWCNEITLETRYQASRRDAPPLAVDLAGSAGLIRISALTPSDTLRYLPMVPLSKLIRVKTVLLQQSSSGKEEQIRLLNLLHRTWCEHVKELPPAQGHAQVCYGIEGLYSQLHGSPFNPHPGNMDELALRQIETLGRTLPDKNTQKVESDDWMIEYESATDASLVRTAQNGARVRCGQLLALHHPQASFFTLGTISDAEIVQKDQLKISVKHLPGRPEAVVLHRVSINPSVAKERTAALLLQPLPELHIPSSLIVPRAWSESGKVLEILHENGKVSRICTEFRVEGGLDYERISYAPAN